VNVQTTLTLIAAVAERFNTTGEPVLSELFALGVILILAKLVALMFAMAAANATVESPSVARIVVLPVELACRSM
jgi:hypothetical protein